MSAVPLDVPRVRWMPEVALFYRLVAWVQAWLVADEAVWEERWDDDGWG